MKKTLKDFLSLLRFYPIFSTLVISLSVMTMSHIVNIGLLNIEYMHIFLGSFSLCLATAASNVFNQITDIDEDKITKPYRPIPSGIFTIKQAFLISIIFYLLSFSISFFIGFYFLFFTSLFILFTIIYSVYPRIKRIFILNQLWIGIARGFILVLGSWSVFRYPFEPAPLSLGLISCIFLFGGMSSKDIFDSEADKKTGVKTLVNVYGPNRTALFSLFLMTMSIFLVIPFVLLGFFEIYHLVLLLFIIPCFFIYFQMQNVKKYTKFENVSAWVAVHATNFLLVFCFCFLTIIFS